MISNLGNILVKLDGIEIYNSDNYISSFDVIRRNSGQHSIGINKGVQNNKSEEYFGQSKGSLWREEALKRIEKYRKKEMNLVIKNQNGKVFNNSLVDIKMNKNDFKFGTAVEFFDNKNNYIIE